MKAYMIDTKMPWAAIAFGKNEKSKLNGYAGDGIPCLVMLDTKGKVLSDSFKGADYLGPNKVLRDLENVIKGKE
jgi:hypothetical protein